MIAESQSAIIRTIYRLALLICALTYLSMLLAQPVAALPEEQKRLFDAGIFYFDHEIVEPGRSSGPGTGGGPVQGCDNAEKIWNFFLGADVQGSALTEQQVAGILGNIQAESGFNPRRVQSTPTPSGDSDTPDSRGYGLVQFTPGTKILADFERMRDTFEPPADSPGDIRFQLALILEQLNGRSALPEGAAGKHLTQQTTVEDATVSFLEKYERAGIPRTQERIAFALDNFTRFTTGGGCE